MRGESPSSCSTIVVVVTVVAALAHELATIQPNILVLLIQHKITVSLLLFALLVFRHFITTAAEFNRDQEEDADETFI